MAKINLQEKLTKLSPHWDPRVVADYNDKGVMVVKFQGEFLFHPLKAAAQNREFR